MSTTPFSVDVEALSKGPWCPTNYLCWKKGTLMQKMRRRVKHYLRGTSAWTTYEYEWHPLPEFKE